MKKNVLITLLVIIIIVLAFVAFKPKEEPVPVLPNDQTTTVNNANGKDYQPNSTIPSSTSSVNRNLISIEDCGVSLSKTSDWSVISSKSNETILDILSADQTGGNGIQIKCVLDSTITDTDAKFGNITYYYDSSTQKWMVQSPNEQSGGTYPPTIATPLFTVNGFSVFRGTRRWLSYIVPISPSSILYLNEGDTEGGLTQSLTNLVKTLKKL